MPPFNSAVLRFSADLFSCLKFESCHWYKSPSIIRWFVSSVCQYWQLHVWNWNQFELDSQAIPEKGIFFRKFFEKQGTQEGERKVVVCKKRYHSGHKSQIQVLPSLLECNMFKQSSPIRNLLSQRSTSTIIEPSEHLRLWYARLLCQTLGTCHEKAT